MPVTRALIGKVAAKTVHAPSGTLPLVIRGATITAATVEALCRRGIPALWVVDSLFPDFEAQEVIREDTRNLVRRSVQEIFEVAGSAKRRRASNLTESRLSEAVGKLVDDVVDNQDVVANLGRVRSWDNYTFEHSVQVATLAVVIGKRMLMTEDQLIRLGTGAILHDVGKVTVPLEILQKPDRLTPSEYEVMKGHARAGWDIVHEGFQNIMPTSSIVVLQHHERLDGSGYPQGLKSERIYIFSKVAAVADVLDAVRAERDYRQNHRPAEVLRIMQQDAGVKLDATAVKIALRHISLVAVGEIVRLTNGLLGMVTALNEGEPLQPVVTLVADDRDKPVAREQLDLMGSELQVAEVLDDWPQGLGG